MKIPEPFGLRVRAATHEPPWGLINRMTLRHGLDSPQELLGTTDLARRFLFAHLASGRRLDLLATLSGIPLADLDAAAVRMTDDGTIIAGRVVGRGGRTHIRRGPFCPRCVSEDLELRAGPVDCRPHRRWWWDLACLEMCAVHGAPLIRSCDVCGRSVSADWLRPDRCPCGRQVTAAGGRSDAALDGYLEARMRGMPASAGPLLDSMSPAGAALAVLQVGGAMSASTLERPSRKWTDQERRRARAAGFEALSDWPGGWHRALDQAIASGIPLSARMPTFGRIQHWLLHPDEEREPLRNEMIAHMARTSPATARLAMFGRKISGAERVTLSTLAIWAGCSLERARSVALAHGCIHHGPLASATPIARRDAERLAEKIRSGVPTAGARMILGTAPDAFKLLKREKIVRSETGGLGKGIFDRAALDDLLARLSKGAPGLSLIPAGALPIPRAAAATNRSIAAIIRAVLDGHIASVGLVEGVAGLPGILVSVEDCLRLPYR